MAVDGELHRIDAVGEVETKIGKIRGPSSGYVQCADAERGQSLMQLRIQLRRGRIHISPSRQRHHRARHERVSRPRIGKEEHTQIQVSFLLLEQSIGKIAIALLLLQLRLHYVGVRRFAGTLTLLSQIGEAGGFTSGSLGHTDLAVGGQRLVEEAGHGIDQSAAGNFQLCRGDGLRSASCARPQSIVAVRMSPRRHPGWHTRAPHCWR